MKKILVAVLLFAACGAPEDAWLTPQEGLSDECRAHKADPLVKWRKWDVWYCFGTQPTCNIWCKKPMGSSGACEPKEYANLACGCVQEAGSTECAEVFKATGIPEWGEAPEAVYDGGIRWPSYEGGL